MSLDRIGRRWLASVVLGTVAPLVLAQVTPPGAAGAPPAPPANGSGAPPPSDNLFIYPRNGQDPGQQARNRYQCRRWAADQTAFDPTRPAGGVTPKATVAKRADDQRAQQACLEVRGYTVR